LTGVGGSGKTRLALELAKASADDYPDGAAFVDLAVVTDGADVAASLLRALGLSDDTGTLDPLERAAARVRTRSMLVIVDNCEHLLDACAEVCEALVAEAGASRVLATSREPLGVPGEQVFVVPSLDPRSDAVDLFVDRAKAAWPDFAVDDASAAVVRDICERLDGIPLAVELAAARASQLSPRQLLERLDDRFRLLTGGRRRVQRHQTLGATLDWSHDLLAANEQTLLRRLAAFPGSFSLEAAESVNGPGDTVIDLGSLVTKSLVDATTEGDQFRYRLLETVRLYAEEKLVEAGESDAVRARHADWVVDAVESVPLEVRWLDEFDVGLVALADVRGALEWTSGAGRNDMAALLASGINWTSADSWREGTRWCEAVVDAEDLPLPVRIRTLVALSLSSTMALSRAASRWAKQAIDAADDLADPMVALAWVSRANAGAATAVQRQDEDLARRVSEWVERGVAMSEEYETAWRVYCRCIAGMTYSSLDQPELAVGHLEAGAQWLRDLKGYEGLRASTLGLLSVHRIIEGDYERAFAAAEPIVATVHTPMPGREGALMAAVARAAAGDHAAARIEMTEYHESAVRTDLPLGPETVVIYGGVIAGLQGDWEGCARLLAAGAAGLMRFPGTYLLYKEFRDRARTALGPDRARQLRAEGQQLPLGEAVATALSETSP
jgi:predicted ATPase